MLFINRNNSKLLIGSIRFKIPVLAITFFLMKLFVNCYIRNIPENKFCHFKGYLRYKTITSQNVLSEAQVKNFFIS